jgi:hypothetical protein
MTLSVEAIKFNHDPTSASHDALNIRVNAKTFVNVPEWEKGISEQPFQSPAAYAIAAIRENTIAIQARFSGGPAGPVKIRAVSIAGRRRMWPLRPFNPLGDVASATVDFDGAGDSDWTTFEVTGHLGDAVCAADIAWQWQAFDPERNGWAAFATTKHRIYVLLDMPTLPWRQTPYVSDNLELPWTEVLDFSCKWAAEAATPDTAAKQITCRIFNLGPETLAYNCPGQGAENYSKGGIFNCTMFLERLCGGPGHGKYVNCVDCAGATSTFANIVGCNLAQAKMGYNFVLNRLLAIGSDEWQQPCGWTTFTFHEVAWKPPCTELNEIYDACLKVNMDPVPIGPIFGMQPTNMRFLRYRPMLSPKGECERQEPPTRRPVI